MSWRPEPHEEVYAIWCQEHRSTKLCLNYKSSPQVALQRTLRFFLTYISLLCILPNALLSICKMTKLKMYHCGEVWKVRARMTRCRRPFALVIHSNHSFISCMEDFVPQGTWSHITFVLNCYPFNLCPKQQNPSWSCLFGQLLFNQS